MRQQSFAAGSFERYREPTRREKFLGEMDTYIPWREPCEIMEPISPQPQGAGQSPIGLERMLRIHFLPNCFDLCDPALEDAYATRVPYAVSLVVN